MHTDHKQNCHAKEKNIDMDEKNIDQWSIILPQSDRGSKLFIYANCVTK